MFDFSSYSKDSKFFDETNNKVIGKMKDECGGIIADEFVGLKSKMYSMKKIDGKMKDEFGVVIITEFVRLKSKKYSIKKKLLVKNIIQQKDYVLPLSLINLKMFYLIKKLLDTK